MQFWHLGTGSISQRRRLWRPVWSIHSAAVLLAAPPFFILAAILRRSLLSPCCCTLSSRSPSPFVSLSLSPFLVWSFAPFVLALFLSANSSNAFLSCRPFRDAFLMPVYRCAVRPGDQFAVCQPLRPSPGLISATLYAAELGRERRWVGLVVVVGRRVGGCGGGH